MYQDRRQEFIAVAFEIADIMLARQNYRLSDDARDALVRYVALRNTQPLFASARSIRNTLDRARLRQASRVFAQEGVVTPASLSIIEAADILASRVFQQPG